MERKLRITGCYLKREGISHSLWINPEIGVVEAVLRHLAGFGDQDWGFCVRGKMEAADESSTGN